MQKGIPHNTHCDILPLALGTTRHGEEEALKGLLPVPPTHLSLVVLCSCDSGLTNGLSSLRGDREEEEHVNCDFSSKDAVSILQGDG